MRISVARAQLQGRPHQRAALPACGVHARKKRSAEPASDALLSRWEALTICALLAADGLARARVVRYDADGPPEARVVVAELLVSAPKRAAN